MTTTDWQIMCRPISSIPAVRQLSAGKSGLAQRSSPASPKGEEVRESAGVITQDSAQVDVRGENTLVWRRR